MIKNVILHWLKNKSTNTDDYDLDIKPLDNKHQFCYDKIEENKTNFQQSIIKYSYCVPCIKGIAWNFVCSFEKTFQRLH